VRCETHTRSYGIRAVPFFVSVHTPPVILNTTEPGVNMAVLRYNGAQKQEPTTKQMRFDLAPEQSFKVKSFILSTLLVNFILLPQPLERLHNISDAPDVSLVLNIGVNNNSFFMINDNLFIPPLVPVIAYRSKSRSSDTYNHSQMLSLNGWRSLVRMGANVRWLQTPWGDGRRVNVI
jgi:hypothetical protein